MTPSVVADRKRAILSLVALVVGAAIPVQLVTLSFGYAQYVRGVVKGPNLLPVAHEFGSGYTVFVYIPALLILLGITLYSRRRYPSLFRRIVVGLGVGASATLVLDAIRGMGVIHGWLPGDTPVMFGRMVTGSSDFAVFWPAGLAVHYLNGASFGLFFTFLWGKRSTYRSAAAWATLWAMVLELGMMLGPPMGPMTGPFGVNHAWPQLFLVTFVAHVFFGIALGLMAQHFLTTAERGPIIRFQMRSSRSI